MIGLSAREKHKRRVMCVHDSRVSAWQSIHSSARSTAQAVPPSPTRLKSSLTFPTQGQKHRQTAQALFPRRPALGTCDDLKECLRKYGFRAWKPWAAPGSPFQRVWWVRLLLGRDCPCPSFPSCSWEEHISLLH